MHTLICISLVFFAGIVLSNYTKHKKTFIKFIKYWFKRPILYYTNMGDSGFYYGQQLTQNKTGLNYVVLHAQNFSPGANQNFLHPLTVPLHCITHYKLCYNRAERKIAKFLRLKISNTTLAKQAMKPIKK